VRDGGVGVFWGVCLFNLEEGWVMAASCLGVLVEGELKGMLGFESI